MKVLRILSIYLFFGFLLWCYSENALAAETPDLIVVNGKILTLDENVWFQWPKTQYGGRLVEAMAIQDDTIVAVGTTAEIEKLAGPETKKLDLKGRMVLPGFVDSHRHTTGYLPQDFPQVQATKVPPSADKEVVRKGIFDAIKQEVQKKKPGDWVIINPQGDVARQLILFEDIKRADLDRAAPNHLLVLNEVGSGPNSQIRFNSAARKVIEKELPGFKFYTDEVIKKDGVNLTGLVIKDIILQGKEAEYAESIKKLIIATELPFGITAVATRIMRVPLQALHILDAKGEMPYRFGWLYSDGSFYNGEGFYRRLPNTAGVGSKYLWSAGVQEEVVDSPSTGLCTTLPSKNAALTERLKRAGINTCFLEYDKVLWATVKDQIQFQRATGYHNSGDKTTDLMLQIIEEVQKETGMTDQQIQDKRIAFEHLHIIRPDQDAKLKKYGILMGMGTYYMESNLNPNKPDNVAQNFGEEYLEWQMPAKRFLDGGVNVFLNEMYGEDLDTSTVSSVISGNPFGSVKRIVTREACFTPRLPGEGEIGVRKCMLIAPEQKVDRITGIMMATKWPAYYLLRENKIGSLEVGKWADFLVIDHDYLTMPEKDIGNIKVLMTVIGGKVGYASPDFGPVDKGLFKSPEYVGKAVLASAP
ncbi:MAG: amidohydrolase family protein [Acidobacteria bacterium]|nr:amidohydrolase family protein [Acidobacteriota bacterium]